MSEDTRHSAYELVYRQTALTREEQLQALHWWQEQSDYHPLHCPVCAAILKVAAQRPELVCPTAWCHYTSTEIPWGVYAAWQERDRKR